MNSAKTIGNGHSAQIVLRRAGLWLVVIVLALQLIGSTCHKHRLAAQSGDSVSTYVAADLLSHTASIVPGLFTTPIVYFSAIGLFPTLDFVSTQSYFIPRAHAPPQDAAAI